MNDQAINEFEVTRARVEHLLDVLSGLVDDHMGVDPETLHWGHVGDMHAIESALSELVARALGTEV